jgi:hypothetical protein
MTIEENKIMPTKTTREPISITYSNGTITISGKSFVLIGSVPSSELMSVYWGSKGTGTARLSVEIDEPVPVKEKHDTTTLREYINKLADQGKTEEEIFTSKVCITPESG